MKFQAFGAIVKEYGVCSRFWGPYLFLRVNACRRGEIDLRVSGLVSTHKYHVALSGTSMNAFGENRPQI